MSDLTDPRVVRPRYGTGSLADLVPSIGVALGSRRWDGVLDLPPAARYAVLLVDGLGLELLREHAADAPYLSSLLPSDPDAAVTCGVPSTTATSLTSLGTGLPPGAHGVVGYTCRIPGTQRVLNALRWDSRVDPIEWQPHPTAYSALTEDGIAVTTVSKRSFESTGLTMAGQRGAVYAGADSPGERLAEAAYAVSDPRSLVYVYDADLDATGHRDGCRSEAWRMQLGMIDLFALRLRAELPADTVLVITADHGMLDIERALLYDVEAEPDLLDGVVVFAGEARLRQLYCRAGAELDVAKRFAERFGDDLLVVSRDEAVEDGWFGPSLAPAVAPRIGDVLLAGLGDIGITSSKHFPQEAALIGMHGSLTSAEMLVPLLVDPGRA